MARALVFALLVCAIGLLGVAEGGAVMGIDFGSANIKATSAGDGGGLDGTHAPSLGGHHPRGRQGTRGAGGSRKRAAQRPRQEVVLNKEGKRKVEALVGVTKAGERVFSALASNLLKMYPELVARYTKHLLGRTPEHPWIRRNVRWYTSPLVADSRGTAAIRLGNVTIPAVEAVAWLLAEAKEAAQHHTKAVISDAVISVPQFFTQWERAEILRAADMAGLHVLSLVHEGTACMIDYFRTRTVDKQANTTGLIVLFDMGDTATRVTLARLDRVPEDEKAKKDIIQASILDATWDDSLGGRNFDENLAQHLAVKASKQTGEDVPSISRAMERLRAESRRVKEVLSANTDIEARVEGLLPDVSFSAVVTRADFERLNAPLFVDMMAPVKQLLAANNLTAADIAEVQVVGGGSRVPLVRETLAAFFGRTAVDSHLNGDDCVCMGAALYAVMKSKAFLALPFRFRDVSLFPVAISHPAVGEEPAAEARSLFGLHNKLYSLKKYSFTTADAVTMRLKYDLDANGAERRLPAGTPRELMRVDVNAVDTTALNMTVGSVPRVMVAFRLTSSGTVEVEDVSAEVSVWELPPRPPRKKRTKATAAPTTAPSGAQGEESVQKPTPAPAAEEEEEPEPVLLPVQVNKTVPVEHRITWLGVRDYSATERAAMLNHTRTLVAEETERATRAELLNDLEALVFATRDLLTDDVMERHANESERAALGAKLDAASEWMDAGEAQEASSKQLRVRVAEIREEVRRLERRGKMFRELPGALEKCRVLLNGTAALVANLTITHVVNDTDVARMEEALSGTRTWLTEKERALREQAENVDPVVTPGDVSFRCDLVRTQARRLMLAPRRVPPTNNATNTTATTNATDAPSSEPEEKAHEDAESAEEEVVQ